MKIAIIVSVFLAVIWYLNKKSSNSFFNKSEIELERDFNLCLKILTNFKFDIAYIDRFIEAYNYFILNPKDYNGTSVINDRWTINGLEIQSLVHDYDWIKAKSLKDLHISNIRYAIALRKVNVNWFWAWVFVFVGLQIVALFKSIKYLFK